MMQLQPGPLAHWLTGLLLLITTWGATADLLNCSGYYSSSSAYQYGGTTPTSSAATWCCFSEQGGAYRGDVQASTGYVNNVCHVNNQGNTPGTPAQEFYTNCPVGMPACPVVTAYCTQIHTTPTCCTGTALRCWAGLASSGSALK